MKKFLSVAVLTFMMLFSGCSDSAEQPESSAEPTKSTAEVHGNIEVTVLDVGKADAMVICTPEHTVVIDCGEKGDGKDVVDFLENKEISTVDYMIITHYDQDHVGGAAKVIKKMDISNVIAPDYFEESKEMDKFSDALAEKNITPVFLTEVMTFSLDGADFVVYPPEQEKYLNNSDNNHSLVTSVTYGETNMLFTGDAMELRLEEIMNIGQFDFLKVPYHGRTIANLSEFLDNVQPSLAAISTSAEELKITGLLDERNISYKATCNDGQITVISDGKEVYFAE